MWRHSECQSCHQNQGFDNEFGPVYGSIEFCAPCIKAAAKYYFIDKESIPTWRPRPYCIECGRLTDNLCDFCAKAACRECAKHDMYESRNDRHQWLAICMPCQVRYAELHAKTKQK